MKAALLVVPLLLTMMPGCTQPCDSPLRQEPCSTVQVPTCFGFDDSVGVYVMDLDWDTLNVTAPDIAARIEGILQGTRPDIPLSYTCVGVEYGAHDLTRLYEDSVDGAQYLALSGDERAYFRFPVNGSVEQIWVLRTHLQLD